MADYRFGLIVAIEPDGSIVRPVERVESKYEAARLCKEYAKKTPGTLYVAMETHEAYRSEPRVEMIFLEYPPEPAKAMVPVLPDHELADLI
jgi:hypothetical protein